MHKPLIGLAPLMYDDKKKINMMMYPRYTTAVEFAGGIPIILPLTDKADDIKELVTVLDGIILTGGEDVNPAYYGEEKEEFCGKIVPQLDAMEDILFKESLLQNKPVFGICRGCQFINASLGGTLYQDIPSQYKTELCHSMPEPPYNRTAHLFRVVEGTPLAKLPCAEGVNSRHHQAILDLAPGLEIMAYAADGIIEAVRMPEKRFVWAVQWHPEAFWEEEGLNIELFRAFVEAAK
jgi:putative glutamine amidotransferase